MNHNPTPPDPTAPDQTPLGPLPVDDPLVVALRGALTRQADTVTASRDGLARIRAAIAGRAAGNLSRPSRPRWARPKLAILAAVAAAVVVAAGVTATVSRPGPPRIEPAGHTRSSTTPPPAPQPTGSTTPTATTPSTGGPTPNSETPSGTGGAPSGAAAAGGLPVYYPGPVGQSYALFREYHPPTRGSGTGTGPTTLTERVQAAITQAMSQRPDDPDYLVLWAAGADARVELTPDLITLTLNQAAAGGTAIAGSGADAIVIQQLIWTATATASSSDPAAPTRVLIRAEGPTPDRFGTISLGQPFRRGAQPGAAEPRAPVWIDTLGQDATVPAGPLTVTGQGIGGPFTLRWTLTRGGAVIDSGTVKPTTPAGGPLGVGLRGTWTITLTPPEPGRYTLTLSDNVPPDAGGGNDSKDFSVQ